MRVLAITDDDGDPQPQRMRCPARRSLASEAPSIGDSVSRWHDRDRKLQTMTPLIDALNVGAIRAYEMGDPSALPGLRMLGAVMNLHGIAMNGGLVGGGIENFVANGDVQAVDDAIEGFRWLDLADVARARDEYLRFRPTGYEDISAEDARVWDKLDSSFYEIAPDDRLETAVSARLQEIAPELRPS